MKQGEMEGQRERWVSVIKMIMRLKESCQWDKKHRKVRKSTDSIMLQRYEQQKAPNSGGRIVERFVPDGLRGLLKFLFLSVGGV